MPPSNSHPNDNTPPRKMTLEATFGDGSRPTPASLASKNQDQPVSALTDAFSWPGRICVLLVIVVAPWLLGSVHFAPQKWIAISLLSGLVFWWFETAMHKQQSQIFPVLFFPIALGAALAVVQLIPLSESWHWLLGRQTEIYAQLTGNENLLAGISVDRFGTWNHLSLLMLALVALLLGCRYFRTKRDIIILLTTLTANGSLIALFGVVQRLTLKGKMFSFFGYERIGQPFGPFVNRNNACCYQMVCMAAAIGLLPILMPASDRSGPRLIVSREIPLWRQLTTHLVEFIADINAKKIAVLLAIVLIGTGVIVSLSRGGAGSMLFGGIVAVIAYGMARQPKNSLFVFVPLILMIGVLVGFLTLGNEFTKRIEQTDTVNLSENARFQHWQSTWPATHEFGLLGSGLGSYPGVHRSYREDVELTVFYFAENQYFQALVEGGWPSLILLLIAWLIAFQSASLLLGRGQSPTTIGVGLAGIFLVSTQAVASFFDFGFYIPANTIAVATMFGFVSYHAQSLGGRLKKRSWLRLRVPNVITQILIVMLFGIVCVVAYDLYRYATIEAISNPRPSDFTFKNMPIEETEKRIAKLQPLVRRRPTPNSANYLASLYIHRCRLQLFAEITQSPEFEKSLAIDATDEKSRNVVFWNWWKLTHLQRLQENKYYLTLESPLTQLPVFLEQPAIQENLPRAAILLAKSCELAPMRPINQLRLAQVRAIVGLPGQADASIERTIQIAPANPGFRNIAGIHYLQSGRPDLAVNHLKEYLKLWPHRFSQTMDLVTGRTNRAIEPLSVDLIGNHMLPDDPNMLYKFARNYSMVNDEQKKAALLRAEKVLAELDYRDERQRILLVDVLTHQGKTQEAIQELTHYLQIRPNDLPRLFRRAKLYSDIGNLELALEDANSLIRKADDPKPYKDFARKVGRLIDARRDDRISF